MAFEAQTRVDVGKGVHVPHSRSVTVEKAGREWIDGCTALERSTADQYEQHLALHIVPLLGDLKLSALTVPWCALGKTVSAPTAARQRWSERSRRRYRAS